MFLGPTLYSLSDWFLVCMSNEGDNFTLVQGCEKEVAEAASEEQKNESLMRLSWALVHSRQSDDVNRGLGMLEGELICHCSINLFPFFLFFPLTS